MASSAKKGRARPAKAEENDGSLVEHLRHEIENFQGGSKPSSAKPGHRGGRPMSAAETVLMEPPVALRLSVPRIEVRLYRRSRTSAHIIKQPPRFEYLVRCEWGPEPEGATKERWWYELPQSYVLRRRWSEIVKFHELIMGMAFDSVAGIPRVKAKLPELPNKGDLDMFMKCVAATGDTNALSRRDADWKGTGRPGDPWDELDLQHTIYVEKRLAPFFEELSLVLAELPPSELEGCAEFKKFVTNGAKCKPRDRTTLGAAKERFCGPSSHQAEPEDLALAVKSLLQKGGSPFKKHAETGLIRRPGSGDGAAGGAGGGLGRSKSVGASVSSGGGGGGAKGKRSPRPPPPPRGTLDPLPQSPPADASLASWDGSAVPSPGRSAVPSPCHSGSNFFDGDTTRRPRMATSHYGFFATSLREGQDFGCSSGRDFWKRMVAKERAELGRRALRNSGKRSEADLFDSPARRLPLLPPATASDAAALRKTWQSAQSEPCLGRSRSDPANRKGGLVSSGNAQASAEKHLKTADSILRELAEGLRVVILGDRPTPFGARKEAHLAERAPATREEALSVYRVYKMIHRGTGEDGCFDSESEGEAWWDDEQDPPTPAVGSGSKSRPGTAAKPPPTPLRELKPLRWTSLLLWAEQKEDFAEDFRLRSVCASLNRSLKVWMQYFSTKEQRHAGVPLTQLFNWIWPDISSEQIVNMLTWVSLREIDRIRYATPRIIEQDERSRLEALFRSMDFGNKGYLTAEDVAGGKNLGVEGSLKNVVDAETVKAVCGDRGMRMHEFLELMCEDNFRAHSKAKKVVLQDGRKLKQQTRDTAGVTIWVSEDPPPSELPQRALIDAIEHEVRRWRRHAALEASRLQPLAQIGEDDDGHHLDGRHGGQSRPPSAFSDSLQQSSGLHGFGPSQSHGGFATAAVAADFAS